MADPIDTAKKAAAEADAAALAFVNKQKGWAQLNAVPLLIGFAAGIVLALIVHYL